MQTNLNISRFQNSIFSSNTYIIDDGINAIVIDTGDFKPVYSYLADRLLTLRAIFITHTHYDHIYGIRDFMKKFPSVPIYTSQEGKLSFGKANWNFSRYHNDPIEINSDRIRTLNNGDKIEVSDTIAINVISTPGHDWSSLTYKINDALFTGDSYIPGIKVISSFPKSNKKLAKEWYNRLEEMSATHRIFPGHNPPPQP